VDDRERLAGYLAAIGVAGDGDRAGRGQAELRHGHQAEDLASLAATFGWDLAGRLDVRRNAGHRPTIGDARAIAATFALQQALPAALSGDRVMLADGLAGYAG
jgi:hypothetical protein